jgi:steroid delta-isomerase-like uncharacterized protein
MTTVERNKSIARRFFEEAANRGNLAVMDEVISADFVDHAAPPGTPPGVEGAKQFLSAVRTSFPDLHLTIEEMIAERDKVVVLLTVHGTHKGELKGIPPTGKQATWKGADILRIAGGKMVERWVLRDHLGMMQQLGILPPLDK